MAVIAALPTLLGSISAATAPYWAAISGGASLFGGFSQAASYRAQGSATQNLYNYNAKVAEYNATQQMYTAEANAAVSMQNRQKEVNELGMELDSDRRKFDYDQAAVTTSMVARGVDISNPTSKDVLRDSAIQFEKEVQRKEYQSGQKQASYSQEAYLQNYYGSVAMAQGRNQAEMLRAQGSAEKAAAKAKAKGAIVSGVISAAASFSSYFSPKAPITDLGGAGTNIAGARNVDIYQIGTRRFAPNVG